MIIDGLIENTLKNTKLKRVRIKVDPSQLATYGYEHVTSFEGYVLHENNETVQVYMLNVPDQFEPVQTVNKQFVTPAVCNTINPSYENLKKKVLLQLEKDGINATAPGYEKILKSTNQEFLETYLQELGYIDEKLKNFFKSIALTQESALDNKLAALDDKLGVITNNPLYKGLQKAAAAFSNVPTLVMGKKSILGRIGRFIKTLNPKELVDVDKYGAPKESIKNNDVIYISNLPGLQKFKKGNITYQVQGTSTQSIFEGDRKINKIIDVIPVEIDRDIDFSLDFSPLGNPNKIGTLIMDFTSSREPTRYYKVKVTNYGKVKHLNIIERINVKEGVIQHQIIQDETRQGVRYALEQLFENDIPSDMGDLINKITDKLLVDTNKREEKIAAFDSILQKLMALPTDQKKNIRDLLVTRLKAVRLIS